MSPCVDANDDCTLYSYRHLIEIILLSIMSAVGGRMLKRMFLTYKKDFMRAGISGFDKNKKERPALPEAQGVLSAAIFILIMFAFIPVPFWRFLFPENEITGINLYEQQQQALMFKSQFIHYLAGMLSICCMVFLGFADDALNLPWRHKLVMPSIASLPLLMVHFANEGTTQIIVPIPMRPFLGFSVNIGILYYIYMGALAVFCTNAINIYAGINGLEVGQTLVITVSVITFNIIELNGFLWRTHLFSLYFLIPFLVVCGELYMVNRFPAEVFVGDTFCYFAGMTLAVVGILGHFSKTLMLFFVPQALNFIISLPQLFRLIPCPRHRLPHFNPTDGLLYPSHVLFHPKSLSRFGQWVLRTCTQLKVVDCNVCESHQSSPPPSSPNNGAELSSTTTVRTRSRDGNNNAGGNGNNGGGSSSEPQEEVVMVTNFTLINLVLRLLGPMSEKQTTNTLLKFQILCSLGAFVMRYPLAWLFYDVGRN